MRYKTNKHVKWRQRILLYIQSPMGVEHGAVPCGLQWIWATVQAVAYCLIQITLVAFVDSQYRNVEVTALIFHFLLTR